jgi:hypothetical protein
MAAPNTIDTMISERSLNTNIANNMADIQTGTTPQGQRFEVAQNTVSILIKPDDDMSDSFEELAMVIAEKNEHKLKELREGNKASSVILDTVTQVQEYLEHMHKNTSMQQLEALAKRILKQANSAGQMLRMVQQEFKEDHPSQYMVMQFVATYAKESKVSEDKLEMAYEAILRLEEDHGDAIFAVVNAAKEGYAYGATGAEVEQFVSTYRDTVLNSKTLSDILKSVLSMMQPKDVGLTNAGTVPTAAPAEKDYLEVINHLIRALGNDMDAVRPSREPEKLHVILQDLYRLQVLNSLLENCRIFARGMEKYAEHYAKAA